MFITLYFIVTRLPDSLRSVRDHFLSFDPTILTIDLLEQHLIAAETSAVAVGAARDTPRTPYFEGTLPPALPPPTPLLLLTMSLVLRTLGLLLLMRSNAAARARVAGVVAVAAGVVVGAAAEVVEAVEVVAAVGVVAGVGALVAAVEAAVGVAVVAAVGVLAVGLELSLEVLEEARGSGSSVGARPHPPNSFVSGCFNVGRPGTCGKAHTQHRCFSRLDDAWRAEFGDEVERPHWAELLRSGVAIFDLEFDAILSTMYALSPSAEGDCYHSVPPDPGIEAAALGASASSLHGAAPAEALHTFTLDSGASRCFFHDSTTLIPLPAPVPVKLADPSGGPDVARSSTVLPRLAVPSGPLSGLHLPSFSTNLVSTAALQDSMVTTTTPGGQRVSICTCTQTGHHLATFTRRPGSSLYTLATEAPQVAASAQVSASGQEAPPCSCRLLSHQTLLWHQRLGHPSLPRLRGMHSRLLVSGLPRSPPPLPPSPAPPCLPFVEGRQRAAPHSSSFPPTTAPPQTLHMDVWGPARVSGQSRERYFLLAVDDYTCYTTRLGQDLHVLRLHSDKGGEFSSNLLREFCRGEGILQSFTLPASPQQSATAEHRIGLAMGVARTSMIHAAAPHFLWPFAVRYAVHQLNHLPRVSLPETSPTLRLTGEVGDASVFRVWGSRVFVRDSFADKLSACAILCDVMFDESVSFYHLFPYRSAPPPPPPLFLAPGPPPVAVGLGAARGAASGGAEPGGAEFEGAENGGAEPGGVGTGGAEPEGVEPGGTASEGVESGGAEPQGVAWSRATGAGGARGTGVVAGAGGSRGGAATGHGGARTQGTGAAGTGGVEGVGAGDLTESGATSAGGAGAGGAGVGGTSAGGAGAAGVGVGGTGAAGTGAVDPGAGGAGGTVRPRPYFIFLLQQILGTPSSLGPTPPFLCPLSDQSQPPLQPASPLPAPSPYTEQSGGLTERREPASCHVSPVPTARRAPRSRPPPVPGTHAMTLRPSSVPLCVPLPAPPASSLPEVPDPVSDCTRVASPTVSHLLDTAVTDPSFDLRLPVLRLSGAAMDVEMASWKSTGTYVDEVPPLGANIVDGMWIFRVKRPPGSPPTFKARYIARGFSQREGVDYFQTFSPTPKMTTLWVLLHVAAERDYELHSLDFSTAFLQGSLHEEIWLRRPPGFTRTFPAGTQWSLRRPVYGLRQAPRKWHDTLRTTLAALGFAPSTADPTTGMGLVVGGRGPVVLTGHADASWVDDSSTQLLSQVYTFILGSGSVSLRSTRSSSVLNSSCEAEIYAGAMAAQELRLLTYLLTDLGEQPRSPPVVYVDNKAMIALCQEHRLEHRTKHIARRYFLARELQQRGQLRLAYMATRANTADVFTKALPPGDHQRFATLLGLVPTLPHLLTA
ncbi:unnamed protein product [Closterium sp. NIES-54]